MLVKKYVCSIKCGKYHATVVVNIFLTQNDHDSYWIVQNFNHNLLTKTQLG